MFSRVSRDISFYKSVLALAGPLMLQNLVNSSLVMFDNFMVSSLGEAPLAGVTLANTVFFVAMLINFGVQSGCTILISQYWGKGDRASINRILGIGFGISGSISLLISLAVTFFARQIYSFTTSDPELVRIASDYARIAAFTGFFNSMALLYISAQRSMGNTLPGMVILCVSTVTNTIMNWLLIYGNLGFPRMGVEGAALATLLSRALELALTAAYAFRARNFRLDFKFMLRPGMIMFKDFIKYSLPVLINETMWSIGFSMYSVIFGHMPNASAGIAAYTITQTIERLLSALYFGFGNVAAVFVGKPLGAGDYDGAHTAGVTMLFFSVALGVVSGLIMFALTITLIIPVIYPLLGAAEETVRTGRYMLFFSAASLPFRAFNFCNIVGVLRGGGDARAGMLLDLSSVYLFALPLTALTGLVLHLPFIVVYAVISLEEVVKVVASYWRFSQKKWLKNVTRDLPA